MMKVSVRCGEASAEIEQTDPTDRSPWHNCYTKSVGCSWVFAVAGFFLPLLSDQHLVSFGSAAQNALSVGEQLLEQCVFCDAAIVPVANVDEPA